jgi:hypothetical protein
MNELTVLGTTLMMKWYEDEEGQSFEFFAAFSFTMLQFDHCGVA